MEVKGICIHNTSNFKDARANKELIEGLQQIGVLLSIHFLVDDKEVIQMTDLNKMTFHTGKALDFGNQHCISIEICHNFEEEKYEIAERNAVDLIKNLMIQFDLSYKDIYFHKDFDPNADCPRGIIYKYSKEEWLKKVGLMPKNQTFNFNLKEEL